MNEDEIDQADRDFVNKIINDALMKLGEHFDSVQIFASRKNDGKGTTRYIADGTGNYFARYGQVKQWLIKEEEGPRIEARKDMENKEE